MIIHFKNIGTSLGTRQLGAKVRADIESSIQSASTVVFDFDGVEVVSNSFADECFAKLLFTHDFDFIKAHTTFKNTNPFVKTVIANSFRQRAKAVTA